MIDHICDLWVLAQAEPPAGAPDEYALFRMMLPLLAMGVLFYLMILRPQRRREQELREMVRNVKENDRVVTVGGIYGVVTNVQRDLERVTVRVDESNGTKIKFNLSAIARVLTSEEKEAAGTASTKT